MVTKVRAERRHPTDIEAGVRRGQEPMSPSAHKGRRWTALQCGKALVVGTMALSSSLATGLALSTLGFIGTKPKSPARARFPAPAPRPPEAQRDALSIYVQSIPATYVTGATGRGTIETDMQYGSTALGPLISAKDDHWKTEWHKLDAWFIDQITTSPLRTYDAAAADIVFVPAMLAINNRKQQESFIQDAPQFLPHYGKKLHLLTLNHAPSVYNERSSLLNHENCHNFTFLTFGLVEKPKAPQVHSFLMGVPQFGHIHWSRGAPQLRPEGRQFNARQTAQTKKYLAAESFAVRHYHIRGAVHEDCKEMPESCLHLDYKNAEDAVPVFNAYRSAWYGLHPRADFVSRSAWFDTLLADSIPVVFQENYIDAVPFTNFFNYTKLMTVVPEQEVTRENATNVIRALANAFNEQDALERIRYIHSIRQVFQYMRNPAHEVVLWSERATVHAEEDAFTFSLKTVMRDACTRSWLPNRCT